MSIVTFTGNSIMPFGAHKGKKLIDVPAEYLLYLSSRSDWDTLSPLGRYVTTDIDALKQQAKSDKNLHR